MDRDEEPRPGRPGDGARVGPAPEDVVPHEHASAEPGLSVNTVDSPTDDPGALAQLIANTVLAIEAVWGEIDPRSCSPDRLQIAAGPCPELLAAFFSRAVTLMNTLNDIVDRLDDANISADSPRLDGLKSDPVQLIRDQQIAKVIDILSEAGVEVDEADVESWTREQRDQAAKWAITERQVMAAGGVSPFKRPFFLPEA
jgi:hypothetical protein